LSSEFNQGLAKDLLDFFGFMPLLLNKLNINIHVLSSSQFVVNETIRTNPFIFFQFASVN